MIASKRIRPLMVLAERIKTDQIIPRKWRRKLLTVNRALIREARKYDEAMEILRGSKYLLEKVSKGKITMERYQEKIRHARQQKEKIEIFAQALSKL